MSTFTPFITEVKKAFDALTTEEVFTTDSIQLVSLDTYMNQLGYVRTHNNSYAHFSGRDFIGFDVAVLMHNGNINARVLQKVKYIAEPDFQHAMEDASELRFVKRVYLQRKKGTIHCVKHRIYFNV